MPIDCHDIDPVDHAVSTVMVIQGCPQKDLITLHAYDFGHRISETNLRDRSVLTAGAAVGATELEFASTQVFIANDIIYIGQQL